MKPIAVVILMVLSIGCSDRRVPVQPLPQTVVGTDASSKEPQFVFVAPDGFVWNDEHKVWYHESTLTSVSLNHKSKVSFQAIVEDFQAEEMLESGLELVSKETREVEGRPTLLVHGKRLNARLPQQFTKVVFGTATGCAQTNAVYPEDSSEDWKTRIENSLLECKYEVFD